MVVAILIAVAEVVVSGVGVVISATKMAKYQRDSNMIKVLLHSCIS